MKTLIHLTLAAALGIVCFAPSARADRLERALIESATTPAQHHALGKYFEEKAAAARHEAEEHTAMGKSYSGAKAAEVARMREHCEKLAATYTEQATQFDALAAEHHKLGGK